MVDWSRRAAVRAGGGIGLTAALGAGWYISERPYCRARLPPEWTYDGEYWAPAVPVREGVLVAEGYSATGGSQFRLGLLSAGSGQARWATVADGGGFGVPAVRDGRVYVGTGLDTVARRRDTLLVGTGSGRVVALPTTPSSTGWPRRWTYETGVDVGGVAATDVGAVVVDQSGVLHRLTAAGKRTARARLTERESEGRCGWKPDRRYVTGAVVDGRTLLLSSRWWLGSFDLDEP